MGEFISHASWMNDIPDDAPVTTLSIPGTHNSCCVDGLLGLAKTQNLDLSDQLNAGIRFFDIRLAHYHDNLCVHHDVVCTERSYTDVLTTFSTFLRRYPSETILIAVKDEDCLDSALGKLAPSRVFRAWLFGLISFSHVIFLFRSDVVPPKTVHGQAAARRAAAERAQGRPASAVSAAMSCCAVPAVPSVERGTVGTSTGLGGVGGGMGLPGQNVSRSGTTPSTR